MWIIASIPFWILGAVMVVGGIVSPFDRRPGETTADLFGQFVVGLTLGGLTLVAAAKIAS